MKLSLRWVCDHLKIDWKKIDVPALVAKFNTSTAEIEGFVHYTLDLSPFACVRVDAMNSEQCEVSIPEWGQKQVVLSVRTDAVVGSWYLVKKENSAIRWVTFTDFDVPKEGLMASFLIDEKLAKGGWKKTVETEDYILDVDNKSITHRPDMWSHRGFAREVAPFLKTTLRDEKEILTSLPVKESKAEFKPTKAVPFSIQINTPACKRFALLYFDAYTHTASLPSMAFRLVRIEQRPLNYLVDLTNYVMFDLGEPMHAFDAGMITNEPFGPRMAKKNETLTLLGGIECTLQSKDMVIANGNKALALAGVKGGAFSSITPATTRVLLEAATFDGGTVRLAATHHKLRTEGSTRFEKEVDPSLNIKALERCVRLIKDAGVAIHHSPSIISLGDMPTPTVIKVNQAFIENRLGLTLKKGFVKKTLQEIGFKVTEKTTAKGIDYTVTVPSYRATKDIKRPEDIVEEVGRIAGYNMIPEQLPLFEKKPSSNDWVERTALLKNFFASAGHMREVQNYSFLDNDFLKKIGWKVMHPVTLANPVSQQRDTLVDSLVVPLLQNVAENSANHDQLGFFEWARAWATFPENSQKVVERSVVAGIMYQRKGAVDFYAMKDFLQDVYATQGLSVTWKPSAHRPQWASRYQIADLIVGNKVVGSAGKVSSVIMAKNGGGDAFAFELLTEPLLAQDTDKKMFTPLAKYQGSFLDISVIVPLDFSVEMITSLIKKADARILQVQLQDVFQKADWIDQKSITVRFFVQDPEKTVSKELLDQVYDSVKKAVVSCGAHVR